MKRYLTMLGIATVLALPAAGAAEVNDERFLQTASQASQQTADAARLAELLARKGVITQQELIEVSAPASTAPAKAKPDQERHSFPGVIWPGGPEGAMW